MRFLLKIVQNGVAATQTGTDDLSDEEVLEIWRRGRPRKSTRKSRVPLQRAMSMGRIFLGSVLRYIENILKSGRK